ncbi:alternative ribosome rescue aminoacyl-tRNA hydrolase ArfB [Tenggerimyces flavus]|uniref:Alternative ribosome rescue aminoacyl-tRNA hydrolase ArfB n=1 Tax=Tenggerimyces flavus TaxID=1708749 RepID=A0ABV7YF44_9ACTN|nr:alternative ribosome rescue aminoacyl-tRNA hydrolase ArfB [Tenggerimyces flavus]MBM7787172.1 ribosome-associated protein [Tenggerimyces flavus]
MAPLRAGPVDIPEDELTWRFSRSSGPGGQSVNTTDSRATVSFDLAGSPSVPDNLRERAVQRLGDRLVDGVLSIAASEHRSQLANRRAALVRLTTTLEQAFAPPPRPRRRTRPTKGSVQRRRQNKQQRSQLKRLRERPAD